MCASARAEKYVVTTSPKKQHMNCAQYETHSLMTTQPQRHPGDMSSVEDDRYATRTNQQPSASDRQAPQEDTEVQILLIGKTGNGKSSTGNTILGRSKPVFEVSTGILSATEHTQLAESDRAYGAGKIKVQVVDFPDVSCDMDQQSVEVEVQRCNSLTYPFPSATCLVVRSDVRFTPEEYAAYRKTKELLGGRASGNLIVVFTMGDKLPTDGENSFSEQLRQANKELRQVLQDADNRYVVFSNNPTEHDGLDNRVAGRGREDQVTQLLDMVVDIQNDRASDLKPLKAILLGPTGSGKSSTGNSFLYTNPQFRVRISFSNITRTCDKATGTVRGHPLEIVDTPGNINSGGYVHPDRLSDDVHQWFDNLSPGPDVLLFVMKGHDRFRDEDIQLFETLKHIIGKDVNKHLIVVFTGGDQLDNWHTTIDDQLRGAPLCLKRLLEEAENRYVVFDNKTDDIEKKLLQRNRLLEEMSKVAEMNKGTALKVSWKPRYRQEAEPNSQEETTDHQQSRHQESTQQLDNPAFLTKFTLPQKCTIS